MTTHNGFALSQLPERFKQKPRTQALDAYITAKYSEYGYKRRKHIEYNPEWSPEKQVWGKTVKDESKRYRWVENVSRGLRHVGKAYDIRKSGNRSYIRDLAIGFYIDNYQDETVHGDVYQLPARDGVAQYVPAVNGPYNNDCAILDFHSVTDDKEQAAIWADQMAERYAEDAREYQAKEDAENRIAEIGDEIKALYTDFRAISRELRENCDKVQGVAVVRQLVREKWQSVKAQIHKLRAERTKIEREGISYY